MRIECADGTAYWDYSERWATTGPGTHKQIKDLKPGDSITIAGPPRERKTVSRVIGDQDYRMEGGKWVPINPVDNGHPRAGVLYQVNLGQNP